MQLRGRLVAIAARLAVLGGLDLRRRGLRIGGGRALASAGLLVGLRAGRLGGIGALALAGGGQRCQRIGVGASASAGAAESWPSRASAACGVGLAPP